MKEQHNGSLLRRPLWLLGLMALMAGFATSHALAQGSTWKQLPDPFNSGYTQRVLVMGVAPNGYLYAGGSGGVSLSTNGGQSWSVINNGLTNRLVVALGFNSLGEPVVGVGYKTSVPIAVFRYTKGVWHQATGISATRNIGAFTLDSTGALIAVTGWAGEVFRSTDNGSTFTKVYSGVGTADGYPVGALYVVHTRPDGTLFTGGELVGGIYRSADNGTTWVQDGLSKAQGYTGNLTGITHNALNEIIAARTATSGIPLQRRSANGWVSVTGVPAWCTVFGLVSSPTHDLFTAVTGTAATQGIYHSTDNGQTWVRDSNGQPGNSIGEMTVDQTGAVYVVMRPSGSAGPYVVYKR